MMNILSVSVIVVVLWKCICFVSIVSNTVIKAEWILLAAFWAEDPPTIKKEPRRQAYLSVLFILSVFIALFVRGTYASVSTFLLLSFLRTWIDIGCDKFWAPLKLFLVQAWRQTLFIFIAVYGRSFYWVLCALFLSVGAPILVRHWDYLLVNHHEFNQLKTGLFTHSALHFVVMLLLLHASQPWQFFIASLLWSWVSADQGDVFELGSGLVAGFLFPEWRFVEWSLHLSCLACSQFLRVFFKIPNIFVYQYSLYIRNTLSSLLYCTFILESLK
jgi:hypothetical protein